MLHKKLFKGLSLRNPLQPITKAIGNTVGVNVSAKGVKIDPLKAALTAATFGIPGVGSAIGGALKAIPGVGAAAGGLGSLAGKIAGVIPKPILGGLNALRGAVGGGGGGIPLPNVDMDAINRQILGAMDGSGSAPASSGGLSGLLQRALGSFAGGGGGSYPSGLNLGRILGTGLSVAGGIGGMKDSAAAEKQRNALVGRQTALADQLAAQGTDLFAGARPMRQAAQQALLSRLAQGPNAFVDRSNPFAQNFAPSPPTPMPSPAIPFQGGIISQGNGGAMPPAIPFGGPLGLAGGAGGLRRAPRPRPPADSAVARAKGGTGNNAAGAAGQAVNTQVKPAIPKRQWPFTKAGAAQ